MNRVFHHYSLWEDYHNGMYDEKNEQRNERIQLAILCLGNKFNCLAAMNRVVREWPFSAEHNLTNNSCNRRAWLGQAACNIQHDIKEDETREAWGFLTPEQRQHANNTANAVIKKWEREYLRRGPVYQVDMFDLEGA